MNARASPHLSIRPAIQTGSLGRLALRVGGVICVAAQWARPHAAACRLLSKLGERGGEWRPLQQITLSPRGAVILRFNE